MRTALAVVAAAAVLLMASVASGTVFLYEDFESGPPADWWQSGTPGLWHVESYRSVSGGWSAAYNWTPAAAPYPTYNTGDWNYGTMYSAAVDVAGASAVYFDVWSWLETENPDYTYDPSFDMAKIGVYDVAFNPVFQFAPDINDFTHATWLHLASVDFKSLLDSHAVSQFRLGFYFDTVDAMYNDYEGWYLDDLRIWDGEDTPPPIPEPSTWLLLSTGLLGVGAAARKRFFG